MSVFSDSGGVHIVQCVSSESPESLNTDIYMHNLMTQTQHAELILFNV